MRWLDAAASASGVLRFLNHAPDVAVDTLETFVKTGSGRFSSIVEASTLFPVVRRTCARFLGRWRAFPDGQWDACRATFHDIVIGSVVR